MRGAENLKPVSCGMMAERRIQILRSPRAWKRAARRRLAEIESGALRAVDSEEVSARVRRIVSG